MHNVKTTKIIMGGFAASLELLKLGYKQIDSYRNGEIIALSNSEETILYIFIKQLDNRMIFPNKKGIHPETSYYMKELDLNDSDLNKYMING